MALTIARRSLLPLPALSLLAECCGVSLPPTWPADAGDRGQAARLLVEAGLAGESGEPSEGLRDALAPLRAPLLTVDVTLAPTSARSPAPTDEPANAFAGTVVLGERALVGLVRRDGVPFAELSLAPPEALTPSVQRLLASVPAAPRSGDVVERLPVAAFLALSVFEGRFDPEEFAAAHGVDADTVARVGALLAGAEYALHVLVVGDRSVLAPRAGQVLLYRAAPGWMEAATVGDETVLRATEPTALLAKVMALVAGVR